MQTPESDNPDIYADSKKVSTILIPDIAWVEVPAGDFIFGEEMNNKTVLLDTFWIGKYPVTNSQYQTFIDAGGYTDDRWWYDLDKPEAQASRWNQPNRPKTDVDWYEAVAFTRWFSNILGYTSNDIRLPTEQEWEKAARGTQGLIYPWGNNYRSGHANINETWNKAGKWNLGQTTAVGIYPKGRSTYGVMDMAGNVGEWCLINHSHPEITTNDSTVFNSRVLRGGSWFDDTDSARADGRSGSDPGGRGYGGGFRVLSSVPIADMEEHNYEIFISYSRKDRTLAKKLLKALELHEWSIFLDERAIAPGERWDFKLETMIEKALCVLVLWTLHSYESEWVRNEAIEAIKSDTYFPYSVRNRLDSEIS